MHSSDRSRLLLVLAITGAYFVSELVGGYLTGSLALLTDAVHLVADIAAILLSLFSLWIASRPARGGKTYGYLRSEILAALLNGLMLWFLVALIFIEALQRLQHPQGVKALGVMLVASIGLVVNGFSAWVTYSGERGRSGMAVRSVFLHVISDLVGSLGVLSAGALTYFTGWMRADPAVSMFIGLLIIYSSWGLVKEGVDILMEGVPRHIDLEELRRDLLSVTGTAEVHDLHVWCLTSRELALSAHAVVDVHANPDIVLSDMSRVLETKFNIRHMTVQLERDNRREHEPEHF